MENKKFDPRKIEKLNDPKRLEIQSPELIWNTLSLENPQVLVDIGAGTGFFAIPFARKIGNGTVYACDSSDIMIQWMNENLPDDVNDVVVPVQSEENNTTLTDAIADLVYMVNLHHELESPLDLLRECKRILKDRGTLLIVDFKPEETGFGPPLSHRIQPETVKDQLLKSGFSAIQQKAILPYHYFITAQKL